MDARVIIDACLAVRRLSADQPRIDANTFAGVVADAYPDWFIYFAQAAVMHIERAQRVADRFVRWRAGWRLRRQRHVKPAPVGSPGRPFRRFRMCSPYINAVIAKWLELRALDRAEDKSREHRFFLDLVKQTYAGGAYAALDALVTLAERDRRFARRFRSWRRSKAARVASPRSSSSSARSRRPRATVH